MSGSGPRDGEQVLVELVDLVKETYRETLPVGDARGLARLEHAVHGLGEQPVGRGGRRPVPLAPRRAAVTVALAAVVAVGAGAMIADRKSEKVTYEVMNAAVEAGGFVRPTAAGAAIVFSEGSEIALGASARTRVDNLTSDGGRVVLESGTVKARIVPRRHARWVVEAGPYIIRVTGTAFDVKWSWADERLDLRMDRGSVIVTGPLAPAGVTLTAGMNLSAQPRSGLTIGGAAALANGAGATSSAGDSRHAEPPVTEAAIAEGEIAGAGRATDSEEAIGVGPGAHGAGAAEGGGAPLVAQPPLAIRVGANGLGPLAPSRGGYKGPSQGPFPSSRRTATVPLQNGGSTAGGRRVPERRMATISRAVAGAPLLGGEALAATWERHLAQGNGQAVLSDAEQRGIDRVLVTASSRELVALADAARYGHRTGLARRALLSVRERFPRSEEAPRAAFFLGGLAEDASDGGGAAEALAWYGRYLREGGLLGRYASPALGRKMVMTERLEGAAAARATATEYLDRFPGGPYASTARKLLRAPSRGGF